MLWQAKSLNPNEFFKLALEQYLIVKCAMLKQTFETSTTTPSKSEQKQAAVSDFMRDFIGFAKQMVGKNSKNPTMVIAEIIERHIIIDIEHLRRRSSSDAQLPRDLQNRSFKQMLLTFDRIDIHAVQLSARLWCLRLMYEYLMFTEKVPKGGNYRDRYETDIVKHVDQIKVIANMSDFQANDKEAGTAACSDGSGCTLHKAIERILQGCIAIEFYTFLNNFAIRNDLSLSIRKHLKQSYVQLTTKFSSSKQINENSSNIAIQPQIETSQTAGMVSSIKQQQQQQQQQQQNQQSIYQQQQESSRNAEQAKMTNMKMIPEVECKPSKALAVNSSVALTEKMSALASKSQQQHVSQVDLLKSQSHSAVSHENKQLTGASCNVNSGLNGLNENSSNRHLAVSTSASGLPGLSSHASSFLSTSQLVGDDCTNSKKVSLSTRSSVLASVNAMAPSGRTMYQQVNKKVTRLSVKQQQQQQQSQSSSSQSQSKSKHAASGHSASKSQSKTTGDAWTKTTGNRNSLLESAHKSFIESETNRKQTQLKHMSRESAGQSFDTASAAQSQQQQQSMQGSQRIKHKRMFTQIQLKSTHLGDIIDFDQQNHDTAAPASEPHRGGNNHSTTNQQLNTQQTHHSDDESSMPLMSMWGL